MCLHEEQTIKHSFNCFIFFSRESRLYKRVCPSICPSVSPSVRRSVTHFFQLTKNAQNRARSGRRSIRMARRVEIRRLTTYFVYTNLLATFLYSIILNFTSKVLLVALNTQHSTSITQHTLYSLRNKYSIKRKVEYRSNC